MQYRNVSRNNLLYLHHSRDKSSKQHRIFVVNSATFTDKERRDIRKFLCTYRNVANFKSFILNKPANLQLKIVNIER